MRFLLNFTVHVKIESVPYKISVTDLFLKTFPTYKFIAVIIVPIIFISRYAIMIKITPKFRSKSFFFEIGDLSFLINK